MTTDKDELATLIETAREARIQIEVMRAALEHIAKVCRGSRMATRRTRWIEQRALRAMEGNGEWRDLDLPKHEPLTERFNTMIVSIYPIVLEEIEARRDVYEGDNGVVDDEKIGRELEILERFVADAKHNVQLIRELPDPPPRRRSHTLPV
jgi:hypothetical protein